MNSLITKEGSNIDEPMESLLLLCKKDNTQLEAILGRYVMISATSNHSKIAYYSSKVIEVCSHWEGAYIEVKAISLLCESITYYYYTKFKNVIEPCNEALKILEGSEYKNLIGLGHYILGVSNRSLGELDIAVDYLIQGTELIDPKGIFSTYYCYSYHQLAEINVWVNDLSIAEMYYRKVIKLAQEIGNSSVLFRAYNGMANLFFTLKDFDRCKEFHDLSLAVDGISRAEKGRGLCDIGIYYYELGDFEKSIEFSKQSYSIRIEAGLFDAASTSLINLGKTEVAIKDFERAILSLKKAIEICEKYHSKSKLLMCHDLMSETYRELGEWENSVASYKLHKELLIEITNKQYQNIYKLKIDQINKQKEIIEDTHRQITDSIRYAKRLQDAILPSLKDVNKEFPKNFINYKPKDVVSGDFYWFEKLNEYSYLAVADCTGHGVPGAMVSIVCSDALNKSVKEFGISQPAKILDKVRQLVIETFAKSGDQVMDGMDVALCAFNGKEVIYSGANNPIWLVRKSKYLTVDQLKKENTINSEDYSLIEYKANKQPIGFYKKMKAFSQESIELYAGDMLYLFTDGFADQFGGERGKKLMSKPFKKLLLNMQNQSMEEQGRVISDVFDNWKGKLEQIDDVCVIGIEM